MIGADELTAALARVSNSRTFGRADRLKHLLEHIVSQTMAGNEDALLGKNIAADVFEIKPGGQDNLAAVRVDIGRLRQRLKLYYSTEGKDDDVVISIPRGGYVASFERRAAVPDDTPVPARKPTWVWPGRLTAAVFAAGVLMLTGLSFWLASARDEPVSDIPRLVVASIENLADTPEYDALADGMTFDIVNRLARFSHMVVVSRRATAQIRHNGNADGALGERTGADYLLSGAIQAAPGGARLSMELIAFPSGDIVWVEEYPVHSADSDVLRGQLELANRISRTLAGKSGTISRLELRDDEALADRPGYACVLRYYAYLSQRSEAAHRDVRACLEVAAISTPGYGEVWASLANVYLDEKRNRYNMRDDDEDPLQRAHAAALKAIELAPESASAHSVLAAIEFFRGDMVSFREQAFRGIGLNPNDVDMLAYFGHLLTVSGNWDEGQEILDRAKALSPVHPPMWHHSSAMTAMREKEFERALAEAEQGMVPNFYLSHVLVAAAHGYLGNTKEAVEAFERLQELRPDYLSKISDDLGARNFDPGLIETLSTGLALAAGYAG